MRSLAALVLGLAATGVRAEDKSVVVLTDANFSEHIDAPDALFVKFYAPWCGHCKRMAPDWEKFAKEAPEGCAVAKLDATAEVKTAEEMKVRGYPTLRLFKNRMMYEYNGARDISSFKDFCENYASQSSARKLPSDEGWVEKVQEGFEEYLQKVQQVLAFEPSMLPLFFVLGVLTGVLMMVVLTVCCKPARSKHSKKSKSESKSSKGEEAKAGDDKAKTADEKKKD